RFPKGMRKVFTDTDHRIGYVLSAIRKKHPAIFELLNSEVGYKIQKAESDILIKAMLLAMRQNVSCLPVHDALLFPHSKKEEGKRILLDAIREITGVEGSVNEEL
ncbi:hypothetical protein OAJ93_04375, partial [Gammaproteobacteria bacterium]|nr:hypothetical protein [Gammaproteobacteria bacterium]